MVYKSATQGKPNIDAIAGIKKLFYLNLVLYFFAAKKLNWRILFRLL